MDAVSASSRSTSVAVCICTFRRTRDLRRLLDSLAELTFESGDPPRVSVVVVDNDPEGTAEQIVEAFRGTYRWPLTYALERRPGIPQARNCCLANVERETDFVCFVDDDEVVEPAWLDRLLSTQRDFDADVVAGPVLPLLPPEAPAWARAGCLFVWARHRTGETIGEAATGNVLFRRELPRRHHIHFNEAMALTGGTDKLFFEELRSRGARMVWCDEAVAHETVPPRRLRPFWFIQRGYRVGTTDARIARLTRGRWRGTILVGWRVATRLGYGILALPVYVGLGKGPLIYNLSRLAYGVGLLTNSLGLSYDEYAVMRRQPATTE